MASVAVRFIADQIHKGQCAKCNGPGPVDVREAHWVWSLVVITNFSSTADLYCRSCGLKKQLGAIIFCFFLGWWGSIGLIVTPIQIIRNIIELVMRPKPDRPSAQLMETSRKILSELQCEQKQKRRHEPDPEKPWRRT